jgi:Zn-dependent M28 family amino/carboxypeptidase
MMRRTIWLLGAALAACAVLVTVSAQRGGGLKPALDSITAADMLRHIKYLSSDELEGRGPGARGEELTVDYLVNELKRMGLTPGNPDGTYIQKVPLAGFTTQAEASFRTGAGELKLERNKDYVAVSRRFVAESEVKDSEMVFVGYGVVAPEYGWDDYKGLDVRGKTVVMLINDPQVPDPKNPAKLDDKMFKGRAMTYYGRWTYKYEIASEKGAAACVIIHETGPAGYPFEVVTGSWGRENFDLQRPDKNMSRVAVEAWISNDVGKRLLKTGGYEYDTLKQMAARKDFKPVPLAARANFKVNNMLRAVDSANVIAKLEGADPKLKDEYVVYTAHWDHLGRDPNLTGDQIFNGALDNASGCATILELAEAFAKLPARPKRTQLFLFVTAEEKGLLGAKHYAENPLYPLHKTLANINIDGVNQWGRTKDLVLVGLGNSTLDDLTRRYAAAQGRIVKPDAEPEKGFFYRSDHFEFAKQGVPALDPDSGTDFIGKPAGYGQKKRAEYTANDYHKPADEIKPDWDLSGAIEDARLFFQIGWDVANTRVWPAWKPGTEFKAKREESLKQNRIAVRGSFLFPITQ